MENLSINKEIFKIYQNRSHKIALSETGICCVL